MNNQFNEESFVSIQCFSVFAVNQIKEVKLEGVTIIKFSKDLLADMRSIKLTETINSLNCKYFLFTLTAFEAKEGEEFEKWSKLE